MTRRTERLNSLLKEVISEVIFREVKNPHVTGLITVTSVDISKDLHHAKVYISVIGTDNDKKATLDALNSAAGFIATKSSKKVVLRYFPQLKFIFDDSAEKHMRIDSILKEIEEQKKLNG
ncbi:MAG: 30S ribosome-binding factor RbfA [Simkaniaceae bacterium]|nr:30S ribosome-binding factor RbfA [Simkaniaceae bacterium]MCF7852923.1 30S ribosome-binding factor RbfA [Simkaniaceae bacterium]